jgi:imidazoleglycerol-phosphate dehydratase
MSRVASRQRATKESDVAVTIDLDGTGATEVSTGLPFYDHMLDQLGRHGEALGDKAGVRRFASGRFPLDEALVDVALDLSGRPFVVWEVELPEAIPLGTPPFDPSLAEHAVASFATAAGITLHVTLVRGRNVHHIVEATFKGLARCLRDAVRVDGGGVPSTKGVL